MRWLTSLLWNWEWTAEVIPIPSKLSAPGTSHTCVILNNDGVKCWGYNNEGQLGQDSITAWGGGLTAGDLNPVCTLPLVNLCSGHTAKAIAAGTYHTCVILDDDSLKCWGKNDAGQLGQNSTDNLGDAAGEMAALNAVNLGTDSRVRGLVTGDSHVCVLLSSSDQVRCWGYNNEGQLGQGKQTTYGSHTIFTDLGSRRTAAPLLDAMPIDLSIDP